MRVLVAGASGFVGSRLCPAPPRAGIGIGHPSREPPRRLVEHLPARVPPRWVGTRTQAIAVAEAVPRALGERAKSRRPA